MAGVNPTGFEKKTLEDIISELQEDEKANIDPAINVASTSLFGQINSIIGDRFRELWDVGEAVYRTLQADFAEGDALDNMCALTNVRRLQATFSTAAVLCTGTPGTFLPAGQIVSVEGTGARFISLADATIPGGGSISVDFQSEVTGPIAAPAGTLSTIVTAVSGWDSSTNPLDGLIGTDIETDSSLRRRRVTNLSLAGDTTDSVLSVVRAVAGVTSAIIFENTTLITDAGGVPGKSFETVAEGGDDTTIATAIFLKKPAGIEAYGTTLVSVNDSEGNPHVIGFSRPVEIPIYIEMTVSTNETVFGGGDQDAGALLVKEAIVAVGDLYEIGDDVISLRIEAAALSVPGVIDVTIFNIGTVPFPVGNANIEINARSRSLFDTSTIEVSAI